MLLKEDFFDDNAESIINDHESENLLDRNYQFTIEIKFRLNTNINSIGTLDNADKVYQELNRLFKYINRKYDVLLSINKHITDYRLSELEDRSYFDLNFNKTIQTYILTIDFDLVPFKDNNELFYFFDSLCFENYRFKSNQSIRWSTQLFIIYKDNKLIDQILGEISFYKIVNSDSLTTEMIEKKPNKINEDFFDDNQVTDDSDNLFNDSFEPEQPIYDYTMEILFYPSALKNWNDNYKIIYTLNYILEYNNHITEHSKPFLCTDYTEKNIDDYLKTHNNNFTKEIRLLQTHYDEYAVIDRKTCEDSIMVQLMNPIRSVHYIKFSFSHSFTKTKQFMSFYTSIYNAVLKYMEPKEAPNIGIMDNNTKGYKGHTTISPTNLFVDNGIGLEAQRLFDFMIPNYVWQVY